MQLLDEDGTPLLVVDGTLRKGNQVYYTYKAFDSGRGVASHQSLLEDIDWLRSEFPNYKLKGGLPVE